MVAVRLAPHPGVQHPERRTLGQKQVPVVTGGVDAHEPSAWNSPRTSSVTASSTITPPS